MQGNSHFTQEHPSPDLEHKTKKAGDKFFETLQVIANEPSLAFFRIQEHVRKSLPHLANKKHEVQDLQQEIQGATFDMEYAARAVTGMEKSKPTFIKIQEHLKNSMFIKQQIKYEQSRRLVERNRPSMYHMLRTQTLDFTGSSRNNSSTPPSEQRRHRHSADLSQPNQPQGGTVEPAPEDSPSRARSSSLSSHSWVTPTALLR